MEHLAKLFPDIEPESLTHYCGPGLVPICFTYLEPDPAAIGDSQHVFWLPTVPRVGELIRQSNGERKAVISVTYHLVADTRIPGGQLGVANVVLTDVKTPAEGRCSACTCPKCGSPQRS